MVTKLDLDKAGLTKKQMEVARLHFDKHMGHKRIALVLELSPSTVRSHLEAVARKLENQLTGVEPTFTPGQRIASLEQRVAKLEQDCQCQADAAHPQAPPTIHPPTGQATG